MIIAALDTSSGVSLSIARVDETKVTVLATLALNETRGALQKLPELVDELLNTAQMNLDEIDRWVVGVGPGSFTGIRIGIAFVKGICMPAKKPFMGVPTTVALARQAQKLEPSVKSFGVCFDGRRQELIYSLVVMNGTKMQLSEAEVLTNDGFDRMLEETEVVVTLHETVVTDLLPSARILAFESVEAEGLISVDLLSDFALTPEAMDASCEPIYVRPAVFTNPLFIRTI